MQGREKKRMTDRVCVYFLSNCDISARTSASFNFEIRKRLLKLIFLFRNTTSAPSVSVLKCKDLIISTVGI